MASGPGLDKPHCGIQVRKAIRPYWMPAVVVAAVAGLAALGLIVLSRGSGLELAAQDLVITTVIVVAGFFLTALLGHKLTEWSNLIGARPCTNCEKGKVACQSCTGTGHTKETFQQADICHDCGGTGQVPGECPQCRGRRRIDRPAHCSQIGPASSVRWELNPLKGKKLGHWQVVSFGVANSEDLPAIFTLTVQVPGSLAGGVQNSVLNLGGHQSQSVSFEFKISGNAAYNVVASVTPGAVTVSCPTCGGTGTVAVRCEPCSGKGSITTTATRDVNCPSCGGTAKANCSTCGGIGRVRRIR